MERGENGEGRGWPEPVAKKKGVGMEGQMGVEVRRVIAEEVGCGANCGSQIPLCA